jgi:hypothetical protein
MACAKPGAPLELTWQVTLPYCLVKIPAKIGDSSRSLRSNSDEAAIALDVSVGGFQL